MERTSPTRVFFAFRDAAERRAALRVPPGRPERYRLFALDDVEARGVVVRHNLERDAVPLWARAVDRSINKPLYAAGGYGGDFASLLASVKAANSTDVVFSTVDTVGIPLALLARAGVVKRPLVYTSIGLPERLEQLRAGRMQQLYRRALRSTAAIVAYGKAEVDHLQEWLGPGGPPVQFVPFGVDVDLFRPSDREPDIDVVSVGVDPRRDFGLLVDIAERRSDLTFLVVAGADNARALRALPANVTLETDIPIEAVRDRFARARVVALPVRDNTYSGATTTLLQAMAMAKPVVVSRTAAIASGYGLEDGVNCRLVTPGDRDAFEKTLLETLTGADAAHFLGIRARRTVERSLTWERYCNALWDVLCSAS
jgi:glycosyltransferase involved in cell wall biosynthesis